MSYYNTDVNDSPAPGTDHKLSTDTFEEWRKNVINVRHLLDGAEDVLNQMQN